MQTESLSHPISRLKGLGQHKIFVPGSKSESNRALILNALSGFKSKISNLATARDTQTMLKLLKSRKKELDVLDAGTTMRFLISYVAATRQNKILTGTKRMQVRPVKILTDALSEIGVDIRFMKAEGYPPVEIMEWRHQKATRIRIRGDVSSQYISSLMMAAPVLPEGLEVELTSKINSWPYISMTLGILSSFGIKYSQVGTCFSIPHQKIQPTSFRVESDWSGASYWYAFLALADKRPTSKLEIAGLHRESLQGDMAISRIARRLGVRTEFDTEGDKVILSKMESTTELFLDFSPFPDLAQTIAVICAAKGVKAEFTGLQSLRIKETDRIAALQNELRKIGADLEQKGDDHFTLTPSSSLPKRVEVETYDDHRMAMAFAPLAMKMDVVIKNPDVVNKSYPEFWEEVRKLNPRR